MKFGEVRPVVGSRVFIRCEVMYRALIGITLYEKPQGPCRSTPCKSLSLRCVPSSYIFCFTHHVCLLRTCAGNAVELTVLQADEHDTMSGSSGSIFSSWWRILYLVLSAAFLTATGFGLASIFMVSPYQDCRHLRAPSVLKG